jgi:acyl dehydratase
VQGVVTELTPSRSRPTRGHVVTRNETLDERGRILQVATTRMLVPRRPGG